MCSVYVCEWLFGVCTGVHVGLVQVGWVSAESPAFICWLDWQPPRPSNPLCLYSPCWGYGHVWNVFMCVLGFKLLLHTCTASTSRHYAVSSALFLTYKCLTLCWSALSTFLDLIWFHVCKSFAQVHICEAHAHLELAEERKRQWSSWNFSFKNLFESHSLTYSLTSQSESSASAPNSRVFLPVPLKDEIK